MNLPDLVARKVVARRLPVLVDSDDVAGIRDDFAFELDFYSLADLLY
jgi:hypothetical protein